MDKTAGKTHLIVTWSGQLSWQRDYDTGWTTEESSFDFWHEQERDVSLVQIVKTVSGAHPTF
jgi:hypothetical protein